MFTTKTYIYCNLWGGECQNWLGFGTGVSQTRQIWKHDSFWNLDVTVREVSLGRDQLLSVGGLSCQKKKQSHSKLDLLVQSCCFLLGSFSSVFTQNDISGSLWLLWERFQAYCGQSWDDAVFHSFTENDSHLSSTKQKVCHPVLLSSH